MENQQPSADAPRRAASVVLMRESEDAIEVLLLRRSSWVRFANAWVFPGGRVDLEDFGQRDPLRAAASRELVEECGVGMPPDAMVEGARWCPPPSVRVRYDTTFFYAVVSADCEVSVDGREIVDYRWDTPKVILQRHATGELQLLAPTWVTLTWIEECGSAGDVFERAAEQAAFPTFVSQLIPGDCCDVVLWEPDAGYSSGDLLAPAPHHRLYMRNDGWEYVCPGVH